MWSCRNVTFRGRRTIGDVRVSLVVAGAAFGYVGASLFVASAAFGDILADSWDATCCIFERKGCEMTSSWSDHGRNGLGSSAHWK